MNLTDPNFQKMCTDIVLKALHKFAQHNHIHNPVEATPELLEQFQAFSQNWGIHVGLRQKDGPEDQNTPRLWGSTTSRHPLYHQLVINSINCAFQHPHFASWEPEEVVKGGLTVDIFLSLEVKKLPGKKIQNWDPQNQILILSQGTESLPSEIHFPELFPLPPEKSSQASLEERLSPFPEELQGHTQDVIHWCH